VENSYLRAVGDPGGSIDGAQRVDSLVAAECNVEDNDVVAKVGFTGRDRQIGGWFTPVGSVGRLGAWVLI
jgi:hypothetical protein